LVALAIGLVMAAGVLGAVVVRPEHRAAVSAPLAPVSTTVTAAPPASTTPTTVAPAVITTAPPGAAGRAPGTATTRPASKPAAPATAAPAPGPPLPAAVATAPAPGSYHYRASSGGAADGTDTVFKVQSDGAGGGVTHQVLSLQGDGGVSFRNSVSWSSSAVRTEHTELSGPGLNAACDWQPGGSVLEYKLPLSVGQSWSVDGTCTASAALQSGTLHRVEQARVTGTATDTVGGAVVRTWVIERTVTRTLASTLGNATMSGKTVEHFSPEHGLFVTMTQSGTATGPDGRSEPFTADLVLVSLQPS
jgi:hypothetical protein